LRISKSGICSNNNNPRPKDAQALFHKLREENASFEEQKVALLNWYNKNKGLQIQEELVGILRAVN
jgi:hypothetical protein